MPIGRLVDPRAVLPLYYSSVFVPSSAILQAFSTPYSLIPAVPGYAIIPESGLLVKEAGTAYTLGGATNHVISWTGSGSAYNTQPLASFLDQTGQIVNIITNSNVGGLSCVGNYGPGNFIFGTALEFKIAGANPTVGNAGIFVQLLYRLWPNGKIGFN